MALHTVRYTINRLSKLDVVGSRAGFFANIVPTQPFTHHRFNDDSTKKFNF
ncbi:hypothetical protein TcasGA2_TC007888 [Tribolium castaneum]|uniref:Uncharacterized protein n=1 Tax=Tribolium castaneum TaxID=7070 RepID=D2A2V7_TRICA|nr:hypothetical protein TcasGA2_TC007888 [Tribolium castaneum]